MSVLKFESKLYLEGIKVPFKTAVVNNGETVFANIEISESNKYLTQVKASTLVHIFILWKDKWRIFFQGKVSKLMFSESSTQIVATSLFNELDLARITPFDLEDSLYGYSMAVLYSSSMDKVEKKSPQSELLISTATGLEFFNFDNLQKSGDIPTFINGLLNAAKAISPWYRIMADNLNLHSKYYILDNPNIFPITMITTLQKLINSALTNVGTSISYQTILSFLLKQLRYVRYELNTPIKINGEWKWVLLLPDPSWTEPIKKFEIPETKLTSFSLNMDLEHPTRVLMIPSFSNIEMDAIQDYHLHIFYAEGGEEPYIKKDNKYFIKFAEEEKYSGIRPYVINYDNDENAYSVIDWSKVEPDKINTVSNKELISKDVDQINYYHKQIAEYKYTDLISRSRETNILPIFEPLYFPCFPIQFTVDEDVYTIAIGGLSFFMDAEGLANVHFSIKQLVDTPKSLEWDPNEYRPDNIAEYHKTFDYDDLMTEEEYWESIGVDIDARYWRRASYLNAAYIAQLGMDVNVHEEFLFTPFVNERAVPIVKYIKDLQGIDIELPEPPGMINLEHLDPGMYETKGREKTKESDTKSGKSKTSKGHSGNKPMSEKDVTVFKERLKKNLGDILAGINDAIEYLSNPVNVGIPWSRNNINDLRALKDTLPTDERLQESYARWVGQESSWIVNDTSAVNNLGYANYGMYQIWGGHPTDVLKLKGEIGFDPKTTGNLSVREQTRRVFIVSSNVTVKRINGYGQSIKNLTYRGWTL